MIQGISTNALYLHSLKARETQNTTSPITKSNVIPFKASPLSGDKLALALQAQTIVPIAKTISFSGALFTEFAEATDRVSVCKDTKAGKNGEDVGTKTNVNNIITRFSPELKKYDDAIKTTIELQNDGKKVVEARTQLKKLFNDDILFEMAVRPERDVNSTPPSGVPDLTQKISVVLNPKNKNTEQVSVLNTKGKLMAVVEDGNDVILTSAGNIEKKEDGTLLAAGKKPGREFKPFTPENIPVIKDLEPHPSIGVGGEIIIGMEDGRFNAEIVDSIREFEQKLKSREITLPQFIAKDGADSIQIAMLAGGFGSRAEYTNASSDGIFHGKEDGAQSTKGVFRTSTGLTPMETTFISLHMAGLLDCSAEKFGIGKNVKFYLNKSGVNKGNGGFTIDLYQKMIQNNQTCEFIFPNDSISRMPLAIAEAAEKMNEGHTAIAMIAKKVPEAEARGTFGIMALSDDNQILKFAEKPKKIDPEFMDKDNYCLTNTFQFAVSKEAFQALEIIEPKFNKALEGKETRDWSKHLVPTIMVLSQFETPDEMRKNLPVVAGEDKNPKFINFLEKIPDSVLLEAKAVLGDQKVIAVPTDESWADVGQAAALYDVTMDIARGDFKLLDFERKNVINSINTKTGLVAMNPEQKEEIENKYKISGEVIVVPKAKTVPPSILLDYADCITINKPKEK